MITREELISSKEYWLANIQTALYNQVRAYLEQPGASRTELAMRLGVSKGYVSQIMKGDFDHKLSKLIEISLAIGKVPLIEFQNLSELIAEEKQTATSFRSKKVKDVCLPPSSPSLIATRKKSFKISGMQSTRKFTRSTPQVSLTSRKEHFGSLQNYF